MSSKKTTRRNNGKNWEQLCKRYLEKMGYYVIRLQDSPSSFGRDSRVVRFTTSNIADYIVYNHPELYLIECKSFNGASMPFGNIRESQLKGMAEPIEKEYKGVQAGFLVEAKRYKRYFYVNVLDVLEYINISDRKSFPIDFFEEKGIELIKSKGMFGIGDKKKEV